MVNYTCRPGDHPEEWSLDYSKRDHEIVDYQYYEMPGIAGVKFRGWMAAACPIMRGG